MRTNGNRVLALGFVSVLLLAGLVASIAVRSAEAPNGAAAPVAPALRPASAGSIPTSAALGSPHSVKAALSNLTFPRTVLIETFTGIWCIHCPAESQALYDMDLHTSHSVLSIAELHVCAFAPGQGPCLDGYVPPDGTSTARGTFYNVCGFPDVFFDGQHDACGASNSMSAMEYDYEQHVNNASAYPGNVSIAQTALVSGANVTAEANITSGLTGSYNVVSYLLEYIGKQNVSTGYGPHDVGYVVRETLRNHPASLTSGESTSLALQGPILTGWNDQNLSVVTFVQDNSTKIVENANMVPAPTMLTTVGADRSTLGSGASATVTVHVFNSTTGVALAGATVSLSSSAGGSFNPNLGTTASDGNFASTFTAPPVTANVSAVITADISAPGYSPGAGQTTVLLIPISPPTSAQHLAIVPGIGQIVVNWSAPASGGSGVTYYLYESSSPSSGFATLTATAATQYQVNGLVTGQTLWFKVAAKGPGGFSPNTTAVSATSLAVTPGGYLPTTGWWFADGALNFTSPNQDAMTLFLPAGPLAYLYGSDSYAILPSASGSGTIVVAAAPLALSLSFAPRLAYLQGTVQPANAALQVNGAALAVTDGSFSWNGPAGTYYLNASASGYVASTQRVTLTPGNVSTVNVSLKSTSSGASPAAAPAGGPLLLVAELAAIAVVAMALAAILLRSRRHARGAIEPAAREPEPPAQEP